MQHHPQLPIEQIRANIEKRKAQGLYNIGCDPLGRDRAQAAIDADKGMRQALTDAFDAQHDYSKPTNTQPIKVDTDAPVFRHPTITPDEFKRGQGHKRRLRGLRQTPVKQQIMSINPSRR